MKHAENTNTRRAQATLDAVWEAARRMPHFGIAEVVAAGLSRPRAIRLIRAWITDGRVTLMRVAAPGRPALYRPVGGAPAAPVVAGRTAEDNLWAAMRRLPVFSPRDLAAHATTPLVEVSRDGAAGYCRALFGAGYLSCDRKGVPGKREALYRLVRNSGPLPPREKRVRAVIDPNTAEIHLAERLP